MLLNLFGTRCGEVSFRLLNQRDRTLNVEARKYVKPGPVGDGNGVGAALREAVNDRFDRIPQEMSALLQRLECPRKAA
jgi:hypothetical protein